jgi:hypothetical protein
MFCKECGKELIQGQKYCSQCGITVEPTQVKSSVIWIIKTSRKLSLLKSVTCYVLFMKDKLILAHLSPSLQKSENKKVSDEIKSSGKGFFKGSASMMGYWADYHKKYYDMSEADILAEDSTNIVVPYSALSEVLFKGTTDRIEKDNTTHVYDGKLYFSLNDGNTIKLKHRENAHKSIKEILIDLFGNKLKYKK